jgi:selenocysteine lyase/cysteine desulfurase
MTDRMGGRLGRRAFLSTCGAAPFAAGLLPDVASAAARRFEPQEGAADAAVFAEARRHFLIPEGIGYCNTGTLGASPREVVDAQVKGIARIESELADWPYERAEGEPLTGYQPLAEVRAEIGRLVSATVEEIALVQNATMGMNFLGHGLDLASGDEVVTTDQEHSGGISVFRLLAKRRGIVLKELPLEPALAGGPEAVVRLFADAITPRTRALMFSHITSGLGIKLPARELCALARDRGALSLVDGAQAVGQIQVDVQALGCDAYVASPHKWLMAPKGTGFLYIRRAAQDRFWTTLASGAWNDREKGAFRFMQYGTGSVPAVEGLTAALQFVRRLGVARIERWDAALTTRLREGLARNSRARLSSPADPRFASAITTFRIEGVPAKKLQDALWARKVRVRAQNDARGVRLSAHLYVSADDIDRVLEVAAAVR